MNNGIARFEKVSFNQFKKDVRQYSINGDEFNDEQLYEIYNNIVIPRRSTAKSAGYDFVSYSEITLKPGQSIIIPTGIKVDIVDGWFLGMYPRSSLGFKYRLQLDNTVGIIDGDYYNNKSNEGHIMVKLTNFTNVYNNTMMVNPGDRFIQGIFQMYGIACDDDADGIRAGGFGSTDAK